MISGSSVAKIAHASCWWVFVAGQFKPDQLFEYYMDLRLGMCLDGVISGNNSLEW